MAWAGFRYCALVVGCGSGELTAELAAGGAVVRATDIDPRAIDLGHATARRYGVRMELETCSLQDLGGGAQYDFGLTTDIIEHIEDEAAAVRKLVDLVRPGGRVPITVPALQALFGYHDEVLGHSR